MKGKKLTVFLSYAFRPKQQAYSQSEILSVVEDACNTAASDLAGEFSGVKYGVTAELSEYGGRLNQEILGRLNQSDICIVDISDNNPNVFYELGALHMLGRHPILLKCKRGEEAFPIPSDILGLMLLKYDEITEIKGRLAAAIVASTKKIFSASWSKPLDLCRQLWGERDANKSAHILVAPRSSIHTIFADVSSPNFIYLDRLGDKDAVFEISVLLARLYPTIPLIRYTSDEIPRDAYESDVVLIGGPGSPSAGGACNMLVSPIQTKLSVPVSYSDDCEQLIIPGVGGFMAEYADGKIIKDYGFFAKTRNPYNPSRTVIIVHGIHTYGVLGAARCFSDHPAAVDNVTTVLGHLGNDPCFWTFFEVDILGGAAMVPKIAVSNIYPLP